MEIDSYVLEETTALNTMKLTSSEREDLLRLYERVAHSPLPSIRDQLRTEHHVRKEIDVALLRLLEMPENQIEGFLSDLYRALFNELEQLREVMSEGRTPTEGEEDA